MSEVIMTDDFVQDEKSEQKGKVVVRTRVIDVDRDKNNFIDEIHSFASVVENRIKAKLIESGEAENDEDTYVRVVMTMELPSSAREFSSGLKAFKNMRMRASIHTKRASCTIVMSRDNYTREAENEAKQKLRLSTVPFKDAKCVMEARVDNGAILLEFRPIASLITDSEISIKTDSGWPWEQVVSYVADKVMEEFLMHMQVYDLVCVFRNVAFESAADVITE